MSMFFHNNSAIINLSKMLSYAVCYKKIKNTMVKFVGFSQQPSSQDLCVNIAHIRSKTFRCVRKCIKFVKVSFLVLITGCIYSYTGYTDYMLNVFLPKFKYKAY